jgi:hypothetical protein
LGSAGGIWLPDGTETMQEKLLKIIVRQSREIISKQLRLLRNCLQLAEVVP